MSQLPPIAEMRTAYQARDASYDGIFFLGVQTTGIFCRPSCPARKPLPENVRFYRTTREALFAGFRPCKRCRPLEANGTPPDWLQPVLQQIEADPSQRFTAARLRRQGIDSARIRRYFQRHHGMTFQAFCRARRMSTALEQIRNGTELDEVALGSGYDSPSGFREAFQKTFGQPPGKSRGAGCIRVAWIESPVGPLVAGCTDLGLCFLEFSDRRMLEAQGTTLRKRLRQPLVPGKHELLERIEKELAAYFAGMLRQFTVPLVFPGTPFQEKVWRGLLEIPYGATWSYEELAEHVGTPKGSRAVGRANGMNRIAIVIPCHRVVNKGGKLGGYGGGLWRKQHLLDLERRTCLDDR